MRQLKTFMRNRKEDMLGCGECTCYTLQCWRNSDVNCGCWGWAVQELEIMPVPDTPWMFSIHMPDNDNWVIWIDDSWDFPIVIVLDINKTIANNLFWFIIAPEAPASDIQWEYIVDEETFDSIINTLENIPEEWGKLSAKDSKVILDAYNDLVKTTIVLKNPRMETIDDATYYLMDLYDYKTNALMRTYDFEIYKLQSKNNIYSWEATLINEDIGGYIYGLVDDENYSSWNEDVSVDWEVVYLAYEYSKIFRDGLGLTWLHAPSWGGNVGVDVYSDVCNYIYFIDFENETIEVNYWLWNSVEYSIDDTLETWDLLWNDCSRVTVTKENDIFSISTDQESLQPLVSVLEWVKNSTLWAILFQCIYWNYTLENNALGIFWKVYLEPTQTNISEAINELDTLADAEISLATCYN